ncbi:MAG TPA: class I SAM-dependent methyltransferase [Edaphobacter sp.]|nr:class I SAM-dependent methyltransferase [Edaphobacter sp.]
MGAKDHWEGIYTSKPDEELSWFQPTSTTSYQLITEFASPGASVVDIGAGSSPLAGQLVRDGFCPVTIVDISEAALTRARCAVAPDIREKIEWQVCDLLANPQLPSCDVWHDRAVFHFLIGPDDQARYVALASRTVKQHGLLIVGTFRLDGPTKCSGLPVHGYDSESLAEVFSETFHLVRGAGEEHMTPSGVKQPFVYVVMRRT